MINEGNDMNNAEELTNYKNIRGIISDNDGPLKASVIRDAIWQAIGTDHSQDYVDAIIHFFNVAIRNGDPDTKELFKKVFYDDLVKYCGFVEPTIIAMQLEGLDDIILIDIRSRRLPADEFSVGYEPILRKIKDTFYHAKFDIPLLIVGETGTSKELLAKTIHALSHRRKGPFQEINCAAIPESLFESELFGVIPDYPGLHNKKGMKGKIELANEGILFLDELGKMDKRSQGKLLKALEEQRLLPVGAQESLPINVRFIAAIQPGDMGNILPDLKYRLGYPDIIKMTTLNERLNEVGDFIIDHSFTGICRKMGLRDEQISLTGSAKNLLSNRKYEGNYRELENILRGALIYVLGDSRKEIKSEDVHFVIDLIKMSSVSGEIRILQTDIELGEGGITDIIDYADKVKASIIEDKLLNYLKSGRDLKSAFVAEGKTEVDYQNFLKKIKKITGKGVRDFSKMPLSAV
jgi:transcriptional regulator with AAA-type ATPase domain